MTPEQLYMKVEAVVRSCSTMAHRECASRYCKLARDRFTKGSYWWLRFDDVYLLTTYGNIWRSSC